VKQLVTALEPDDVVLGGGNIHKLKVLPPGCRPGDNDNAFLGGFRLWQDVGPQRSSTGKHRRIRNRTGTQVGARKKTGQSSP